MNGRKGPLLLVTNFTTTTIVNRSNHASISNVEMLNFMYIVLRCIEKFTIIGALMFNKNIDAEMRVVEERRNKDRRESFTCWLGIKATKYENITNIPPI